MLHGLRSLEAFCENWPLAIAVQRWPRLFPGFIHDEFYPRGVLISPTLTGTAHIMMRIQILNIINLNRTCICVHLFQLSF